MRIILALAALPAFSFGLTYAVMRPGEPLHSVTILSGLPPERIIPNCHEHGLNAEGNGCSDWYRVELARLPNALTRFR